eukprot:43330-Chlamydomonas_euryale.AAC.1
MQTCSCPRSHRWPANLLQYGSTRSHLLPAHPLKYESRDGRRGRVVKHQRRRQLHGKAPGQSIAQLHGPAACNANGASYTTGSHTQDCSTRAGHNTPHGVTPGTSHCMESHRAHRTAWSHTGHNTPHGVTPGTTHCMESHGSRVQESTPTLAIAFVLLLKLATALAQRRWCCVPSTPIQCSCIDETDGVARRHSWPAPPFKLTTSLHPPQRIPECGSWTLAPQPPPPPLHTHHITEGMVGHPAARWCLSPAARLRVASRCE